MKYNSKKDFWLAIIVWIPMLMVIGIGVFILVFKASTIIECLLTLILFIALPMFMLWIWLTTYYVIDENDLIIRSGPFKKTIPLENIKSIRKTMNPVSGPAMSLKRLEIIYNLYSFTVISPKDRDEFINQIKQRCPHVKVIKNN